MGPFFGVLSFLSLVALIFGLIKPAWFNKVFKGTATRKKIGWTFGIAAIVLFVIGIAITPSDNTQTSNSPSAPIQNTGPETTQQKLDDVVKSQLQQTSLKASYKDTSIEKDDSDRPTGSQYVTIDIDTGEALDENEFITDSGKLAAGIFQQVFPIDSHFYDVLVAYYGNITDQYGNTTSSMLMSYEVDRPLYSKINWSGLGDVQNDVHLCAFLREQENILPESNTSKLYIGCTVIPSNLRQAEGSIETSNPQYRDIPQYR